MKEAKGKRNGWEKEEKRMEEWMGRESLIVRGIGRKNREKKKGMGEKGEERA